MGVYLGVYLDMYALKTRACGTKPIPKIEFGCLNYLDDLYQCSYYPITGDSFESISGALRQSLGKLYCILQNYRKILIFEKICHYF